MLGLEELSWPEDDEADGDRPEHAEDDEHGPFHDDVKPSGGMHRHLCSQG